MSICGPEPSLLDAVATQTGPRKLLVFIFLLLFVLFSVNQVCVPPHTPLPLPHFSSLCLPLQMRILFLISTYLCVCVCYVKCCAHVLTCV